MYNWGWLLMRFDLGTNIPVLKPHLERLELLYEVGWRLGGALLCLAISVFFQLCFPKGIGYFVDNVDTIKQSDFSISIFLLALVAVALHVVVSSLQYYLFESCGQRIVANIRERLFDALINKPIGFFDKHHVGELSTRLTSDVQSLQFAMTIGAAGALHSICIFIGAVFLLLSISVKLGAILALFIPVSLYLGKLAGDINRKRSKQMQTTLAESGKVAHEHFSNVRQVHAYNQQESATLKYVSAVRSLLGIALSTAKMIAFFRAISSSNGLIALVLTLWIGAHLIWQGTLSVGDLTAVIIYSTMITESVSSLAEFWNTWMKTLGATDQIFDLMRTRTATSIAQNKRALSGRIDFDNLSFSYPERPERKALKNISFTVFSGEKIALVGASGAGKSTISNLILGFYQPDTGQILFDSERSEILGIAAIRDNIAIVEQEPSLFSGSIFDNIAFAIPDRTVSMDEVTAAATQANAHDFICGFPNGYSTVVGERGVQLSGGQKQRIAIARALLRNPKILILDEATSALDATSEHLVQAALEHLMTDRTTIIIAHRFSTVVNADRILVMNNGEIGQSGKHDDLVKDKNGLYFQLMQNQLFTR